MSNRFCVHKGFGFSFWFYLSLWFNRGLFQQYCILTQCWLHCIHQNKSCITIQWCDTELHAPEDLVFSYILLGWLFLFDLYEAKLFKIFKWKENVKIHWKLACLAMAFVILFFYLCISLKILSAVVLKDEKYVK